MADDFITAQDVSDILGRDVTSDPGAAQAISSACAICRAEAQQNFNAGTATIYLDGTNNDVLLLPQDPPTVTSVVVSGGTITDYVLTEGGKLLRGTAGADPRPTWPSGRQNVQVTYSYGYGDLEVPVDVCRVATDLAIRIMVQGPLSAETVGDASVTYAQPRATDLNDNERRILRRYRTERSF